MTVPIEVVGIGCDLGQDVRRALQALVAVQSDFRFTFPPAGRALALRHYDLAEYNIKGLNEKLAMYREKHCAAEDLNLIGIVDSPLEGNAFGFLVTSGRHAVMTISDYSRYSRSLQAFLCFYFVRFALAFLGNGAVRSHETRGCIFDNRKNKRDLIPILENPKLCDDCIKRLEPHLREGRFEAVIKMGSVIAQLHERTRVSTLIMKGGGVKGLAFAGSLEVLMRPVYARRFRPMTFVGTSAGAIAASLLAAGCTADELKALLARDFKTFLDPWWKRPLNFIRRGGFHTGYRIVDWVEDEFRKRLHGGAPKEPIRMPALREQKTRLIVYAANRYGTLTFDSDKHDIFVSTAVRFSMSIPLFFTTLEHDGEEVFDGGLLNNYPLEVFLRDEPNYEGEFVALYLSDGNRPRRPSLLLRNTAYGNPFE